MRLLAALIVAMGTVAALANTSISNPSPVIGVLAEPSTSLGHNVGGTSFIAASYVKWLEAAGARVVPLPFDLPELELQKRLEGLNGVLFPGGG